MTRNISEWCKRADCWTALKGQNIRIVGLDEEPLYDEQQHPVLQVAERAVEYDDDDPEIRRVSAEGWRELVAWGREPGRLPIRDLTWVGSISSNYVGRDRPLTPLQVAKAREIFDRAVDKGFVPSSW